MLKEWMNTFENQNAKWKQIFEKKQNNAMKSLEATNSKGHKSCVA